MSGKRWSDLSPGQRKLIGAAAAAELTLKAAALLDLRRRPAEQVRGSKKLWAALQVVNLIGPVSYFAFGRRK